MESVQEEDALKKGDGNAAYTKRGITTPTDTVEEGARACKYKTEARSREDTTNLVIFNILKTVWARTKKHGQQPCMFRVPNYGIWHRISQNITLVAGKSGILICVHCDGYCQS
jgi:hypothetical protein